MSRKLGFIGLGVMGANMCRRIREAGDYELVVFDVDSEKVRQIAEIGAMPAQSLGELARATDLIACSLPNPEIVRKVFLEEDGVLAAAPKGTTILDFSTVDAETSKAVAQAASAMGMTYVDTPVSGGKLDSLKGTLTIIAGATEEEMQPVRPLLEVMGQSIHYAGTRGAGSAIKLVNNVMSMGNLLVAAEAFVLGVKAGVDADTLFSILQHCGGRSLRLTKKFPNILKRRFEPGFTVDLAEKDLRLAMDMAHSLKVPMMMASISHDQYLAASSSGRGGLDATAVIQLLEELTGIEVKGSNDADD